MAGVPAGPRGRLAAAAAAVLVLALALGVTMTAVANTTVPGEPTPAMTPDEAALTALVTDYWTALFNNDVDALTPLLCEDDRADALEVANPDVTPADPPVEVTVDVTAIRISEPYAAITNSTNMGTRPGEAYAQRFDGQWLLCSDAAFLMPDADGTPATPTN